MWLFQKICEQIFSFLFGLGFDKIAKWIKAGSVRRYLGKNNPNELILTYAVLYPPESKKYFCHGTRENGTTILKQYRIYPAVSEAEIRSIAYLNSLCSQNNISVQIKSDEETDTDFESNLLSVGLACFKTFDTLTNNSFIDVEDDFFKIKGNDNPFYRNSHHPYGIILRTTSDLGKTRIVCGGFNEWGTSGAAYCLAKKYKQIIQSIRKFRGWFTRWSKIPDFLVITEGAVKMDEKSQIVEIWILNKNQIPMRVFPSDASITHKNEPITDDEYESSSTPEDFGPLI